MLIAALRLLFERSQDNVIQANIDLHFARGWREFSQWQLAGEHFIEDHAE